MFYKKEINVYEYYKEAVTIGVYDDHAASAKSDELEYAYLCSGCAEERNGNVAHLSTTAPGWPAYCADCGRPNRTEEEEEEEEEEGY